MTSATSTPSDFLSQELSIVYPWDDLDRFFSEAADPSMPHLLSSDNAGISNPLIPASCEASKPSSTFDPVFHLRSSWPYSGLLLQGNERPFVPGSQNHEFWNNRVLQSQSLPSNMKVEPNFNPESAESPQTAFCGHISTFSGNEKSFTTKQSDDLMDSWSFLLESPASLPNPCSSSNESSRESSPSSSSSKTGLTEEEILAHGRQRHLFSHLSRYREGVCRWRFPWGVCNHTLDSDRGIVSQHLTRCHQYDPRKPKQLISCQWEGCTSRPMQASTMARHIKTHLGFLSNTCPKCNNVYTRDSSLDRHMKTCNGVVKGKRRRTRATRLSSRSANEEVLGASMFTKRMQIPSLLNPMHASNS